MYVDAANGCQVLFRDPHKLLAIKKKRNGGPRRFRLTTIPLLQMEHEIIFTITAQSRD